TPDCMIYDQPIIQIESEIQYPLTKGDLYGIESELKSDWLKPVLVDQEWAWTLNPKLIQSYTYPNVYSYPSYSTVQSSEYRGSMISAAIGCLEFNDTTGD